MLTVPLSLIVLDCDGVILESVAVKTEAFWKLFIEHGEDAADRLVAYHLANGGVSRFEKFAWFYREILGRTITPAEEAALNKRFTGLCLQGVLSAGFVPGVVDFLHDWHEKLPLYVASGTPDYELQEIFLKRDLSRYFKGVYGSPPGKTPLLEGIVTRSGVNPAMVLMVGDSSTDLEAAIQVGTLFFGRGLDSGRPGDGVGSDLTSLEDYLAEIGGIT